MTSRPDDSGHDPLEGATTAEVDARFADIVAALTADASDMSWSGRGSEQDAAVGGRPAEGRSTLADRNEPGPDPQPAPGPAGPAGPAELNDLNELDERQRRRALRKAERAEEVAAFEAARAQAAAELEADDEHFVPPEPPPLPRPRRRTVAALLLMLVGVVMIGWPGLLQAAPDAVMILGLISLMGGFSLLVAGLRRRSGDPENGEGWDDGAQV